MIHLTPAKQLQFISSTYIAHMYLISRIGLCNFNFFSYYLNYPKNPRDPYSITIWDMENNFQERIQVVSYWCESETDKVDWMASPTVHCPTDDTSFKPVNATRMNASHMAGLATACYLSRGELNKQSTRFWSS
jgi:saccharopine dehydrogenase-like NADP-dependent oxidoreductase